MCRWLKYLLAIVGVLGAAPGTRAVMPLPPSASSLPGQDGLSRLFFQSSIISRDPELVGSCFNGYIAYSSQISSNYSADYNKCMREAIAERRTTDNEVLNERTQITSMAESVCSRIQACNSHNATLDVFNCHAAIGSNNTKITYAIAGNATKYATLLQEAYRSIEVSYEQCCQAAERLYVERTADNFKHLKACLDGRDSPRPGPGNGNGAVGDNGQGQGQGPSHGQGHGPPSTNTTTTTTTEAATAAATTDQFERLLN